MDTSYGQKSYIQLHIKEAQMEKMMKRPAIFIIPVLIALIASCTPADPEEYYELKIYRFETAEQEARLDHFLESAYLPALHRAGVENVGVFKLREQGNEPDSIILILVPFNSLGEYIEVPGALKKDDKYLEDGKDYIQSPHHSPPYTRIETMLLKAFSGTPRLVVPDLNSPRQERVYELRSYQGATEQLYERKVEMFDLGESALFKELGFNPVFFAKVISSSQMPHLMYMTTFSDTTSQQERWNAFRIHPDWLEMKEIERYKNTVSDITRYLLYPTPYSDY